MPLDWSQILDMLWSPLWFTWDLCGTVGILFLVKRWITGSVTDTKKAVIHELKDPETGAAIRASMDIVDSKDIKELRGAVHLAREEIRAKDLSYQTTIDSRMGWLIRQ